MVFLTAGGFLGERPTGNLRCSTYTCSTILFQQNVRLVLHFVKQDAYVMSVDRSDFFLNDFFFKKLLPFWPTLLAFRPILLPFRPHLIPFWTTIYYPFQLQFCNLGKDRIIVNLYNQKGESYIIFFNVVTTPFSFLKRFRKRSRS